MINKNVVEGINRRMNSLDCNREPFRLVFWDSNDEDLETDLAEYREVFAERGWDLIDCGRTGPLALKARLRDESAKRFVILRQGAQPEEKRDPLIDLRLANPVFTADRWALYLDEIGLGARADLQEYVAGKRRFFKLKANRDGLAHLGLDPRSETPERLDLKLLAVIAGAEEAVFSSILLGFFSRFRENDDLDATLAEFGLSSEFWELMRANFNFIEAKPALTKLALKLFSSDLEYSLGDSVSTTAEKGAAFRFCQAWRNTVSAREGYRYWSEWFVSSTGASLEGLLSGLDLASIQKVRSFDIEKRILSRLVRVLTSTAKEGEFRSLQNFAADRKGLDFWLNPEEAVSYRRAYRACEEAARFMNMLELFNPDSALSIRELAELYISSWYRIDQAYRLYREEIVNLASWELFKELTCRMDSLYTGNFLQRLSAAWDESVLRGNGTIQEWKALPSLRQPDFYKNFVLPYLEGGERRRVFVIVSDAMRFEIGKELEEYLTANARNKVQVSAMQTILPSITRIGMAALLPHERLSMHEPNSVLVDEKPSTGLESRNKILAKVGGIALDALELVTMKRETARALVKDKSVVYLYHDKIDATGDKQVSEENTFSACREAIDDILRIVTYVFNSLQGSHIVITADHGFLFIPGNPPEEVKSSLPAAIPGIIESKKRYLLGRDISEYPGAIRGNLSLSVNDSDLGFLVPRGIQRFHFKGGAQFFHGGIMPEESIVPVLTVKPAGESAKLVRKKVDVGVLALPQTITTRVIHPRLHQDEPVSDSILARKVRVGIYREGKAVSDEPVVVLNSTGSDHEALRKIVQLHLLGASFNPRTLYRFSVKDEDTGVELYGQEVRISLMILEEF